MGRRSVFDQPSLQLAEDLLAVGRVDLHSRVVEALRGSPLEEWIVSDVQDELARIVSDGRVAERDRREASRLIGVGDDLFGAIGREGVVHLAWRRRPPVDDEPSRCFDPVVSESEGIYQGSWGLVEGYEASPEFDSLAPAMDWARVRAPWVVVVPWWDQSTQYWIGDGAPPDGYEALPDPPDDITIES